MRSRQVARRGPRRAVPAHVYLRRRVALLAVLVGAAGVAVIAEAGGQGAAGPPPPAAVNSHRAVTPAVPGPKAPAIRDVVALGDSVPAGTACTCTPYVDLVADALATAQAAPVAAHNLAVAGQTTAGLIAQLHDPHAVSALRRADVVIVTIGANDLEEAAGCSPSSSSACYASDLRALRTTYAQMLTRVHALVPRQSHIIVTGYWSVFLDGSVARHLGTTYVRNSKALTYAVNSIIASAAATASVTYVDVFTPFRGDGDRDDTALLAADGDHPSAAGHRVIAASILATLPG